MDKRNILFKNYDKQVKDLYKQGITEKEFNEILNIFKNSGLSVNEFINQYKIMDHWTVLEDTLNEMGYMGYENYWWDLDYFMYDTNAQINEINENTSIKVYNIVDDMDFVRGL